MDDGYFAFLAAFASQVADTEMELRKPFQSNAPAPDAFARCRTASDLAPNTLWQESLACPSAGRERKPDNRLAHR